MAVAIDVPVAGEIARGRGGFYRAANVTPYVSDPSGDLVKSGARKGKPKRLAYGSPSSRGKQIENTYNLQKWGERRVVLGLGVDLALIADCARLATLDVDSDEYKELADTIVLRAKDAAEANLAAERGTHGHALTEDHDEERDWIQRAEAGELLGLPTEAQASLVDAWNDMLERNELEILAVEASCVDDTWKLAGTLDRIARCRRALRFSRYGGDIVEIPAGTVLVLDVKSGKRRLDRNGVVMYWQAYAIQIASYAQSLPYDTEAETRGAWPWEISQDHALIAHLDVLGALDGNPSCELVYVDLAAGREHGGETVVQAKAWEKRTDVFSIAQLDDAPGITEALTGDCDECPNGCRRCPAATKTAAEVVPHDPAGPASDGPPAADAEVAQPEETPASAPPAGEHADPSAPAFVDPRSHLPGVGQDGQPRPDEGDVLAYDEAVAAQERFARLPKAQRQWISARLVEAQNNGVIFHLSQGQTVRRLELVRGLMTLAEGGWDEAVAGGPEANLVEVARAIAALALESDVALWPAIAPGHAIGACDHVQARHFAQLADDFVAGRLAGAVDPDGTFRLLAPANSF